MKLRSRLLLLFVFLAGYIFSQPVNALAQRKKLNLDALKPADYKAGIINIKFKTGFELQLNSLRKNGGIETGLKSMDAALKILKTKKIESSFEKILNDAAHESKHQARGLDRWFTIELPPGVNTIEAIKYLNGLTDIIEIAEPSFNRTLFDSDKPVTLWTPNDSAYMYQWHFNNTNQQGPTVPPGVDADIDLPEAWNIERGKPDVIVAVIDGGVDTSHPDLKRNLWIGADGTRFGKNWNDQTIGVQANLHGTHVCGTVAAVNNNSIGVSGIAGGDGTALSGARIMSMQIFSPSGVYAGDAGAANAFVYAADHGACIAQNSWGGGDASAIISDGIDYFIINGGGNVLNGGIVIFSGGNNANDTEIFPGSYPPVICVAATDYNDKLASYSNFGSYIDISAPGGDGSGAKQVLSTLPGKSYGWLKGTSMAAPHVSGVAALCVSKAEGILSNDQLRNIILNSADDIYPLNPAYIGKMGSGRVNAYSALQQVIKASAPLVNPVKTFAASASCGYANLQWTKNDPANDVVIAQADTLIFGTPAGSPVVGDNIEGGGKIIYKGSANAFSVAIAANTKKYYRIWSYSGNQYSFPKTSSAYYTQTINGLIVSNAAGCIFNLSWTDDLACISDSVLIVENKVAAFTTPFGILNNSNVLATGEKVIYKGRDTKKTYTTGLDSNIYFAKWNFNASHQYINASIDGYVTGTKPNAIEALTAVATSGSSININWSVKAGNCFNGSTFLLACNTDSVFGEPSGIYIAGDNITGGGKIIYTGSNNNFQHVGLTAQTTYYYKVWMIKAPSAYSYGKVAEAKTLCLNSIIQIPFKDGFEGGNLLLPDECFWSLQNNTPQSNPLQIVTTGSSPIVYPVEGNSLLRFNSFLINSGSTARLVSAPVKKGINTSMDIRFRWYQDSSDYVTASYLTEGVLVQWSADKKNWKTMEFYPRVPVQGNIGWSYKQLTLPDTSLPYDTVYIALQFTSAYGNNCYLDNFNLNLSSYKPADNTTAVAVTEFTDSTNLWTHLYDTLGNRLISIKKNGNNIGNAGQSKYKMLLGPAGSVKITTNNNYVTNTGGWASVKRYYLFKPLYEQISKMSIRYYYFTADVNALDNAASTLNPSRSNIQQNDLYAWKINDINSIYNVDPATGHTGILQANSFGANGFVQYAYAGAADTATWVYKNLGNNLHSMEYTILHSGGGAFGIGSVSGKGALQAVTYTFTGNGNWSNSSNWLNNNKPPAILPNTGFIIIDPVTNGECVLDVSQVVPPGASIQVNTGKTFRIKAGLQVQVR
jgi:subtilisin family serine protease